MLGLHRADAEACCVSEIFYGLDHIVALVFVIALQLSETYEDLDVNIESRVYLRRHYRVQDISNTEPIVLVSCVLANFLP